MKEISLTKWVISVATAVSIGLVMFIGSVLNDHVVWQPELSAFEKAHAAEHEEESKTLNTIQVNQEGFKQRVGNIEKLLLKQTVRDLSADLRELQNRKRAEPSEWTDVDQRMLDRTISDLQDAELELEKLNEG